MKRGWIISWVGTFTLLGSASGPATEIQLSPAPAGGWILDWESDAAPPYAGTDSTWFYQPQWSPDGRSWQALGNSISHPEGSAAASYQVPVNPGTPAGLFRIEKSLQFAARAGLAAPPADYGVQYDHFFDNTTSLADFSASNANADCLSSIDWDVTTAGFWPQFNTSPAAHNAGLSPDDPERRIYDFRMSAAERAMFEQNGMVVSGRLAEEMPVDVYYNVWTDDLPVFISCDSVLDAWHRSYILMLEELEELYLYPKMRAFLVNDFTAALWSNDLGDPGLVGAEQMRQAMMDLEIYTKIAGSLSIRTSINTTLTEPNQWWPLGGPPKPSTVAILNDSLNEWYSAALTADNPLKPGLFGDQDRLEDMTQFSPRGHYTNSAVLRAHFRSFMWMGRVQFRIAGGSVDTAQSIRELRAAALLCMIIRANGWLDEWSELEGVLELLGGERDSMGVPEMLALLDAEGLNTYRSLAPDTAMQSLQARIMAGNHGLQRIPSSVDSVACNPAENYLPRSFALFGQRWSPDAWAMSKVVFPEVRDAAGGILPRRMPSGMDVAYTVFGNDAAAPILVDRMQDACGVPFRDGFPFHHNLQAVRGTLDAQSDDFWTAHIYNGLLNSIRGLSGPAAAPESADVFRTAAWKDRTINSQLASWTQLRHDTLLYTKQSYTGPVLCDFPDGYVDPYPEAWDRIAQLADHTATVFATLPMTGTLWIADRSNPPELTAANWDPADGYRWADTGDPWSSPTIMIDAARAKADLVAHFQNFADRCQDLRDIANRQANGQPLSTQQASTIKNLIENVEDDLYISDRLYDGWFPQLYYRSKLFTQPEEHPSDIFIPTVVDVHTDGPDVCRGDPGGVLHQGVGLNHTMFVAVRHPDGSACMYAGPVFSHYEFIEPFGTRLNDAQWKHKIETDNLPSASPWTTSFLAP